MRKKLEIIDVNEPQHVGKSELTMEEKRRRRQRIKARQQAIKRRKRKRLLRFFVAVVGIAVLGVSVSRLDDWKLRWQKAEQADAVENQSVKESNRIGELLYEEKYEEFFEENKPEALEDAEVYQCLKKLAKEYPELKEIYEKREEYPLKLLAALCNNPEMQEYVKGYLTYGAGDTSQTEKPELTEAEKKQKYPLFLQWDKRWGYEEYGDFNIALSGCGPATLAMAAVALTGDDTITPDRVATYSMNNGYYVEGTGTAWSLMTDGCENWGIKAKEIVLDELVMKNELDEGKVIICSMRQGDFTSAGHFVMIYGYREEGFFINDANCIYRSSRTWTYEELKNQIRMLWVFEEK